MELEPELFSTLFIYTPTIDVQLKFTLPEKCFDAATIVASGECLLCPSFVEAFAEKQRPMNLKNAEYTFMTLFFTC